MLFSKDCTTLISAFGEETSLVVSNSVVTIADGAFAAKALGGEMGEIMALSGHDTRHVIVPVKKITETLPLYPRKNGIPAKRPLKCGKK